MGVNLPPGYQIERHSPRIWYASKIDVAGISHPLLNERRKERVFRSEVSAVQYCRGHHRQGLNPDQAVQQKRGE